MAENEKLYHPSRADILLEASFSRTMKRSTSLFCVRKAGAPTFTAAITDPSNARTGTETETSDR